MIAPGYLVYVILGSSVAVIAATLYGLQYALLKADWLPRERRSVVLGAAVMLLGWFAAIVALSVAGTFRGAVERVPTIPFAILLPILLGAALIWRSALASRLIDAVSQPWLVGVQIFRGLGGIFFVLYAGGMLPGLFALPAGLGDVLVAILAPIVALAYARNPSQSTGSVLAWNLLGIADLIVAVATGFATSPSPFQIAAFEAPNELISSFPLVLIPVYLVPLWIVLHMASLAKLWREAAHAAVQSA